MVTKGGPNDPDAPNQYDKKRKKSSLSQSPPNNKNNNPKTI